MIALKTIDAHVGGAPLRLVIDGFPAPRGRTMGERRAWAMRHADELRRVLMLEPRGHADMCGAVLTEPTSPASHAGLLFMHNAGYSSMSGHGVIAAATIALERGLLMPGGDGRSVIFDTPAGTIRVHADVEDKTRGPAAGSGRVNRVSFLTVPSFVLHGGVEVVLATRRLRADIAFGGAFYAIVDSEAVGLPLDGAHIPEIRRVGMEIKRAIEKAGSVTHPLDAHLNGIEGIVFTGPAHAQHADLRNVTVFADGQVDRSSCGTGMAAVMAVLDAMGLLLEDQQELVEESVAETLLSGRVVSRIAVADYPAIVAEIQGSAWITGEHTFLVDSRDPLAGGFLL